jgi:hypothetical protein
MKSQLPALIMLLSEFRKPSGAGDTSRGHDIQPGWSFGIEPTPAVGEADVPDSAGAASVYGSAAPHEAGGLTPRISRGAPDAPWARSKKKRFG